MEDSAWPFPAGQEPAADTVLIYGPGDTPHTWTPGDINEQTARYRFPGFVRSNPLGASYVQDCNAMVAWLKSIGAPIGIAVFWDMETAVAPGYLSAVGHIMNLEGYKVLPYGSIGSVWQNPLLDGLFVSHPDGVPHLCTPIRCGNGLNVNALITQYLFAGSYDMSLIDPSVSLWDTRTHPTLQEFDDMFLIRNSEGAVCTFDGTRKRPVDSPATMALWQNAGAKTVQLPDAEYAAIPFDTPEPAVPTVAQIAAAVKAELPAAQTVSLKGQTASITFD